MPHSHHSHSGQFCKHASGLLEDVVLEAIRQGFEVFGLSEHTPRYRVTDLYPEEEGLAVEALLQQYEAFLDEAHRLKEKYSSQITLLVGIETEVIEDVDLDHLQVLLDRHGPRIQYLVGSIHHVNGIPIDFDQPTFRKSLSSMGRETEYEAQESFLVRYFQGQYNLLCRFQPDIIGHFDLCRLYDPDLNLEQYPSAWQLIERNIRFAIGYGALFEVNAAAFRKQWNTAYPGRDVLELILRLGGKLALSDDSHGPHAVGLNYDKLAKYLQALNVQEIWYLSDSGAVNHAGRPVQAVKLSGNWWEHHFWKSR
ncbi:hypothetical protein AX16_001606 [Volvariella volvacea WC 439]|nr:hypothetical protein AX16_001606 [Volvariella volvacea WC 439]